MESARPRWSPQIKLVISLLLIALGVYLLFRFSVIFPPLILAVILAYILSPLAQLFSRRFRLRHVTSVVLTYLLLLIVLVTLPVSLVPLLAREFADLNLDIQHWAEQFESTLEKMLQAIGVSLNGAALIEEGSRALASVLEPVFGHTLGFAFDVISSVVWLIFIVVVSFYFVKDGQAVRNWVEQLVPPNYRQDYVQLREQINKIWGAFFRGQIILALVVSLIITASGLVLGLPFAFAMGVLAGLLEFLPSIGHGIWLALASVLALSLGSTWLQIPNWTFALLIIMLHMMFQQFDLNYLIPRIIGHSVHLPPLVVILGIVAGAVFAGVLGIPLAAPAIASARVIGRYIYANLFDLDPFSETMAPLPPPKLRWWRGSARENVPLTKGGKLP